jgi:hypothetical protein
MGYLHVEIEAQQVAKHPHSPCGDVLKVERYNTATLIFLSDGKGSGVKANIAATMCVSRLQGLIARGFSLRESVSAVVKTMIQAIEADLPYAVFTVARIQSDGYATILTYDMPEVIFVTNKYSTILEKREYLDNGAMIAESNCYMNPNEALILTSDGITQAGMGLTYPEGWGIENVNKYINNLINKKVAVREIPLMLYQHAFEATGMKNGDDISSVLALTRLGVVANVLAGPPQRVEKSHEVASHFINMKGIKIVCGATTARIVGDELGKNVMLDDDEDNDGITPPKSTLEGIDLVTEGLVTLNQLYNVLDENRDEMRDDNPVTQLYDYLILADRVNFFVGTAFNPANVSMSYKQRGLIPRKKVIGLIAEKLREMGKMIVVTEV